MLNKIMATETKRKRVAVIGSGLVGALNACFFAERGFIVDMYEMRQDIRTIAVARGRSINLAMSRRALDALEAVGLADIVLEKAIFMRGRMIHNLDWSRKPIAYGTSNQWINSVDRRLLNEVLLTAAEHKPDVTMFFEYKLVGLDFDNNKMSFKIADQTIVTRTADLIVGCDGAFSETRRQFMRSVRMDYEQQYIDHGYMELTIPATEDDQFAMEPHFLHIWPRHEYMMIALPNIDNSFTVTLFMPFAIFESITTDEDLIDFFRANFPDSIHLLNENELKKTYFSNKPLPLLTVKCFPYHIRDCALIMGDAAHAMVPFYGQGMNCGFEDCLVLDDFLTEYNDDFQKALAAYSERRTVDASAICDLALYNYIEMRSHVNSVRFLMRKKLDNFLYWIMPAFWVPLYTMVSFTRIRYSHCISRRRQQDKILSCLTMAPVVALAVATFWVVLNPQPNLRIFPRSLSNALSRVWAYIECAQDTHR